MSDKVPATSSLHTAFAILSSILLFAGHASSQPVGTASSMPFHAEGLLSYQGFAQAGTVAAEQRWSFSVDVAASRWTITLAYPPPITNLVEKTTVAGDGTLVYQLSVRQTSTATNYVPGSALVRMNPVPYPDDALVAPIWLALASAHFLDHAETAELKPVWFVPDERVWHDARCRFACKVTRAAEPPGVPLEIAFLNPGTLLAFDDKSESIQQHTYPAPFNAGFTQAVYHAESLTAFGSLRLPNRFSLAVYRPDLGSQTGGLERYLLFTGTLTTARQLETAEQLTVPPPITTRAVVSDYRVRIPSGADGQLIPVSYLSTNAWLVDTNDTRFQRVLTDNLKLQDLIRASRSSWSPPKALALAALVAVGLAPAALWFRRQRLAEGQVTRITQQQTKKKDL